MLDCIHQDIGEYGLAFLPVDMHFLGTRTDLHHCLQAHDMLLVDDITGHTHDPIIGVGLLDVQICLAHLHLSQIEDHIKQVLHSSGLPVDAGEGRVILAFRVGLLDETLERSHDEGERSTELVTYVQNHLDLILIGLFLLLLLQALELFYLSGFEGNEKSCGDHHSDCHEAENEDEDSCAHKPFH